MKLDSLMNSSDDEQECWLCYFKGQPEEEGNCVNCRRPIQPVDKDPQEELQFFCVLCDRYFMAARDQSGFDQAVCPDCGDLSNTREFHAGQRAQQQGLNPAAWQAIAPIMTITFLGTTLLWTLFRWLASWW